MHPPTIGVLASLSARRPFRLLIEGSRRCAVVALLAMGCAMLGACSSRPGPPVPAEGAFGSAGISIDSSGREHVVIASVVSPGHSLELDSTWEAYRGRHVFVTIRRPDARFSYPPAPVDLRLLTQVSSRESITVFARTAGRDEKEPEDQYRRAASFVRETAAGAGGSGGPGR